MSSSMLGKESYAHMERVAHERYAEFDDKRRKVGALAADAEDIEDLEGIDRSCRKEGSGAS